ncbi:hypothetical protein [Microbacterium panaciterrae]|uniref:Uncharacterized protein n=1 Tax=Microbacterium panaciterrae TaxID=985759 RepID=A0ABP8PHS4_9MICO
MSQDGIDRDRHTQAMLLLDDGLRRIADQHKNSVDFEYEDPLTFGGGHFVFYPEGSNSARFAIEEQYEGTDWSDEDRLPTSWTWRAERIVRHPDGSHYWGTEREGETKIEDLPNLLVEVDRWVRKTENRATQSAQFGAPARRQEPPAPRL